MTGGRVAEVPGGCAESCRGDEDDARVSFVRGQDATQRGPRDRTVCGGVFGGRARRPAHTRAAPVHILWHWWIFFFIGWVRGPADADAPFPPP